MIPERIRIPSAVGIANMTDVLLDAILCNSRWQANILLAMRVVVLLGASCFCGFMAFCQQTRPDSPLQPGTLARSNSADTEDKRILGIAPNYRTSPSLTEYKPISAREKFVIATQDSFDRGTVILAAAFAGQGQLTNANRSFGQGAAGYGRYFGTSYADFVIGNYMTEAIFPTFLHQDPTLFPAWHRQRVVEAGIRYRSDFLDAFRFRLHAVQLFGNPRQLNRGRHLKRLLPGQP